MKTAGDAVYASLYVHVPFCLAKCPYCSFVSVPLAGRAAEAEAYPALVAAELAGRRLARGEALPAAGAATVYVGGGTPLALSPAALDALLAAVAGAAVGPGTAEFSVEGIPHAVDQIKAGLLAARGVTRVTLGVQSLDRAVAETLGRAAALAAFPRALQLLRAAGIGNLGVDLIIGLPGETAASFEDGVRRVLDAGVGHLSAYVLSVEAGTSFAARVAAGEVLDPPDFRARRMLTRLGRLAEAAGFTRYEVSNWARPGRAARHNQATWRYGTYAGVGAAAVGFDGTRRRRNPVDLAAYRALVEDGATAGLELEVPGPAARVNERLLLALRTTEGLDLAELRAAEGRDLAEEKRAVLDAETARGRLRRDGDRLRCTAKGLLWLDDILPALLLDER